MKIIKHNPHFDWKLLKDNKGWYVSYPLITGEIRTRSFGTNGVRSNDYFNNLT